MYEEAYSASMDNLVKASTIGVFILLISLIAVLNLVSNSLLVTTGFILLFSVILFLPYLMVPRGYVVSGKTVVVKRPLGEVRIILAEAALRWKWTWWGLRLFGSGGLYGYYGFFIFKGLGMVRMCATNRHNLVLVRDVNGRKYLLSPDEPERFIQQTQTPYETWTTST